MKRACVVALLCIIDFAAAIERRCPPNSFPCKSGKCIPAAWVCDEADDCGDLSDERHHSCPESACGAQEFRCSSGRCVPDTWRCDDERDCDDGGDEDPLKCRAMECSADKFTCHTPHAPHNGTRGAGVPRNCIPLNWVCDSERDCGDGSDERYCNATCTSEQFTCSSGKCISVQWRCDGDTDCGEGDISDEQGCPPTSCSASEVRCGDMCIDRLWLCDGETDCKDGEDEANCTQNRGVDITCQHDQVLCPKEAICLKKEYLCDGDQDCASGWDESPEVCTAPPCPSASQFRCGDGTCVDLALRCNGFPECVGGEDELRCPGPRCNGTDFECPDGTCIPAGSVCDGVVHCLLAPGGADEAACGVDECAVNNGGCEQLCVDDMAGYHCECRPGYYLVQGAMCHDINECVEPGVCSQRCVNLPGTHKCECVGGYSRDPHHPHRCKAMEGHASLLFAHDSDIRKISLDHQEVTAIVNETRGSTALDFVFKTGMIFWTDLRDKCIYKAPIDEGNKKVVVVQDDVTISDGLAVDWLYNHLYWTNSKRDAIELSDFHGKMRKTLLADEMDEPRAIAIYPLEGWLFWTDWGRRPKIERAGMDGTHRQAIITERIKWPNAITVDFVLHKLYWADSKEHAIFCSDLDGTNRRTVLQSPEALPHPFSLTVFEDTVYWTDWTREAILSADKFTGANVVTVAHVHIPMTVHVYHSYRQPNGTNHCTPLNGLCTHLCLPAPQVSAQSPKITCACPDGMTLMSDNLTCEVAGAAPPPPEVPPATGVGGYASGRGEGQPPLRGVSIVVISVLTTGVLVAVAALMSYLIYRYFRKRSMHSMNFDNPVYKKTTTASPPPPAPSYHHPATPPPPAPSYHHQQQQQQQYFASNAAYNNSNSSSGSLENAFHLTTGSSGGSSGSGGGGGSSHSSFCGGGGGGGKVGTTSTFCSNNRNPRLKYGVAPPDECLQPLAPSDRC